MNRAELKPLLERSGIRPSVNDPDGGLLECYSLEQRGRHWSVYYDERGTKSVGRVFETEDEACRDLVDRVMKDHGASVDYPRKDKI